jgi:hypothetical protein
MKTMHIGKIRFHFRNLWQSLSVVKLIEIEYDLTYKFISLTLFNLEFEIDW